MSRRRKPASQSSSSTSKSENSLPDDQAANTDEPGENAGPGSNLKILLSLWLIFHLFAITLSYTGVVGPSETHSQINEALQVYLRPAHFAADGRPIYLARGEASEQPHRLQTSRLKPLADANLFALPIDDSRWETVAPPGARGLGGNDRYHRWLSTAATLSGNEQPSLVAELLLPAVIDDTEIKAVRIVRLPTELTTTADDSAAPPYAAYVARKNANVSLVQVVQPRLSTQQRGDDDE